MWCFRNHWSTWLYMLMFLGDETSFMATSRWTNAVGDGSKKVRYRWCGIWRRGEHWWLLIGYIYVRCHSSNLAKTWQFVSRYVYLRRYEQRNAPSLSSPIAIRWNLSSKCTLLFQRSTACQSVHPSFFAKILLRDKKQLLSFSGSQPPEITWS